MSILIPIVIALILVIGVSTMIIISTTTIPVSGQIGERCRDVPIGNPIGEHTFQKECCPEGHHWECEHLGRFYWDCVPGNPKS